MELKELFIYRQQLLDDSKDEDGYISDAGFVDTSIPALNETKHIDTTDVSDVYYTQDGIKVNAYTINESEERLQIFIVNEDSLLPDASEEDVMISQRAVYEKHFNRALNFIKKSIKRQINDQLQDGSPAWVLIHQLETSLFVDQIDVVEIFLLSASATVERRGTEITPKTLEFDEETISVSFSKDKQKFTKELIVIKRLVDLNFLYNVYQAYGSRSPLVIDFSQPPYNNPIPCLPAASESDFDSYLCALPAKLLTELYKRHSSRLLEKNVRSFLQLKGVNKGMQDTIKKEPEKFIAYNNGLTITATASELITSNGIAQIKSLTDFQIVNGGQTTATLYFSQKSGLNIGSINVMAKINVAKGANDEILDDLISNISTYSNAQSKVSKVDLRARSPQLIKIKSLSESVLTVSGKKWFFERAKGEYATMVRINSKKKAQIEKAFPKDRRFTKEDLAKYYAAWGDKPYAVKKGGEKIFRLFLEEISGEGKAKKAAIINRSFYEDVIARIILFRSLEKIYGSGNNSLGQIRSVVVPYSLSIVYAYTTGGKKAQPFDLLKIWKAEKLDGSLEAFFRDLMKLVNSLVKQYSKSDDLGEYSKKPELWDDIVTSKEIAAFMEEPRNRTLVKTYTISPEELKRREKEASKIEDLDFEPLLDMTAIFDKGSAFYRNIYYSQPDLTPAKSKKLETISAAIQQHQQLDENHVRFEKELLKELAVSSPELLNNIDGGSDYIRTAEYLIKRYNNAVSSGESVQSSFTGLENLVRIKGIEYASVFGEIGRVLDNGELPSMKQIKQAMQYCKTLS
ncbi:AIPR family protein [Chitinophagaceae bacterium MMS25-I14]